MTSSHLLTFQWGSNAQTVNLGDDVCFSDFGLRREAFETPSVRGSSCTMVSCCGTTGFCAFISVCHPPPNSNPLSTAEDLKGQCAGHSVQATLDSTKLLHRCVF